MKATYKLEHYNGQRTRHTCPRCGKRKEFTRYIDTETGTYLADDVGRCNRDKCRYHYPPREFFRDNPEFMENEKNDWKYSETRKFTYQSAKNQMTKNIQYIPYSILKKTLKGYQSNNFVCFLTDIFGEEKALHLADMYRLGTSKKYQHNGGNAVVFWQIDIAGNVRQAKVMAYDARSGKRLKADGKSFVSFMGKNILMDKEANLQQCLFGEHLLSEFPGLPVALVESEKTAVVMAGFLPDVIWLATGGKNGARWTDRSVYKALKERTVVIYPDLGAFDEWEKKAKYLGTICDYEVSDLLEKKAQGNDWQEGYDIADYFIKVQTEPRKPVAQTDCLPPGWQFYIFDNGDKILMNANGYPAIWDSPNDEQEKQAIKQEAARTGTGVNPLVGKLIERLGLEPEKSIVRMA